MKEMPERLIMTRVVRGKFPGRDFDIEFWQRLGDAEIAAAAWNLVVLAAAQRGIDADQLRLQRSVVTIQRNRRPVSRSRRVGGDEIHGTVYTKDIDLWVEPAPESAGKVFTALRAFGAPTGDLSVEDLCTPGVFFQIGIAPNRIVIMTAVPGLSFADAWQRAETFNFDELGAPVLSHDDIIRAKQTANRMEDRIAVKRLKLAKNLRSGKRP